MLAGSIVCYTPEVKTTLMRVDKKLIDRYSCESKQVTEALISGLQKLIRADIYAAITGLASEGGSETTAKPVGTVFFCIRYKRKTYNHRMVFKGSPLTIRELAAAALYGYIYSIVGRRIR